jgi:ABC-2 type transport system ATP-binding protein
MSPLSVAPSAALALDGVSARIGSFALHDVSFTLPTGYVMGFVGPNGAGKTTTIRCLLGMLPVESGRIEVLGTPGPLPPTLRQDVGVVLDHSFLVEDWRLVQVEAALRPCYDRWDPARYRELLGGFGLAPSSKVKELSRGQSMKLAIAVALSHGARLLVLDEPTSGLDPVARDELVGILGEFLTDPARSVLFSTHITADLERIADYVTLIDGGRIVRSAPKDELLDGYRVVRGGPGDLADDDPRLIGPRRTGTAVEALVATEDADDFGPGILVEAPTLDEVVVHVCARTPAQTLTAGRRA